MSVRGGWRPAPDRRTLVGLGPLEAAVLRSVWDQGRPVTVRDIYEDLLRRRKTAYTTVMTTVATLRRKGLLRQDRRGRAYLYEAAATDIEVAGAILEVIVAEVLGGNARSLIARVIALAEAGGETDPH